MHRSLHFDSLKNCFVFQTINWNYLRTGSLDWSSASQTNGHPHSQTYLRVSYRTFAKVGDWFPILSYNFNSVAIDRIFSQNDWSVIFLLRLSTIITDDTTVFGEGFEGWRGRNSRQGSRSQGMFDSGWIFHDLWRLFCSFSSSCVKLETSKWRQEIKVAKLLATSNNFSLVKTINIKIRIAMLDCWWTYFYFLFWPLDKIHLVHLMKNSMVACK